MGGNLEAEGRGEQHRQPQAAGSSSKKGGKGGIAIRVMRTVGSAQTHCKSFPSLTACR